MSSFAESRHRYGASLMAVVAMLALSCAGAAIAATFTVNVTGDADDAVPGNGICRSTAGPGTCTLRAAITEANATSGHDTIAFAIGSGVQTIMPATALPRISDSVTIDGGTQSGFVDRPIIEVNGELTLSIGFIDGFYITASDTTISSLVINTYGFDGIRIVDADNIAIVGNYIGTNVAGQLKFYANPSCDPSGYGEGKRLLGTKTVSTDGNGVASFNAVLPAAIAPGAFVTATATSASGSTSTSEFSACVSPRVAGGTS